MPHHKLADFILRVQHELHKFGIQCIHNRVEIVRLQIIRQAKDFVHATKHVVLIAFCSKLSVIQTNHARCRAIEFSRGNTNNVGEVCPNNR